LSDFLYNLYYTDEKIRILNPENTAQKTLEKEIISKLDLKIIRMTSKIHNKRFR